MPLDSRIDTIGRITRTHASGVVTAADFAAHEQLLRADPAFDPKFDHLLDMREVTELAISSEELRKMAQNSIFDPSARRALVAPAAALFGASRMYATNREIEGHHGPIRIFKELDEAMAWLAAARDA